MTSRLGWMAALLLAVAGCANAAQSLRPGTTSACGNRCDAMVCPQGSSCTMDGNCNTRCEPEHLPQRLP